MIAVYIVQNNYAAENNIKSLIQSQGIQLKIKINDVSQTEIFTTNNINPILFNVHQLSLQKTSVNPQISETLLIEMEKTKQKQEDTRQMEVQLELLKFQQNKTIVGPIAEPIVELIEPTFDCIYKRFIHECIKKTDNESDKLFHSVMYSAFEKWFVLCFPDKEVPSDKAFSKNITKYIYIEASIRIGLKVQRGCRGYQLI
jgi:hypothetical protein